MNDCPALERWRSFIQGEIDDQALCDAMAQHLNACADHCLPIVEKLQANDQDGALGLADADVLPIPPAIAQNIYSILQPATPPAALDVVLAIAGVQIATHVGEGGFGVVFKVEHSLHGTRAVKVLKPEFALSHSLREILLKEGQAAAQLRNDHVVIVHHVDQVKSFPKPYDQIPFIEMEYIEQTLHDRMFAPNARFAYDEIAGIIRHICEGLKPLHDQGKVHRDIKPGNVLFDKRTDRYKINDFGLAWPAIDSERLSGGHVVGTEFYMSPEQKKVGQELKPSSDMYSVGVMFYQLLTRGRTPGIKTIDPPRRAQQGVPRDLDTLCMRLLAIDATLRLTAHELADDLQRYINEQPIRARPMGVAERAGRYVKRNRGRLGAAAAVVMLLAAIVGYWQWESHTSRSAREQHAAQALAEAAEFDVEANKLLEAPGSALQARLQALPLLNKARDGLAKTQELYVGKAGENLARIDAMLVDLTGKCDQCTRETKMLQDIDNLRARQADTFDRKKAAADYTAAFRAYGIDVLADKADHVGAAIRAAPIAEELIDALDDWTRVCRTDKLPDAKHLLAVTQCADADPDRMRIRDTLAENNVQRLKKLAQAIPARAKAGSVFLIGNALGEAGAFSECVDFLIEAQRRFTADFWINHHLGYYATKLIPPNWDLAVKHHEIAVQARPNSYNAHLNLSFAHSSREDLDLALTEARKARDLDPKRAKAWHNIGVVHFKKREWHLAAEAYEKVLELDSKHVLARNQLGFAYVRLDRADDAIRVLNQAIALDPKYAEPHTTLGLAFGLKKDWKKALDAHLRALAIDPTHFQANINLANACKRLGDSGAAKTAFATTIAWLEAAIRKLRLTAKSQNQSVANEIKKLEKLLAIPHNNLGSTLTEEGKSEEAAVELRKAIAYDPTLAEAYTNLGVALQETNQDQAIAANNKALELNPKLPQAHNNLATALRLRKDREQDDIKNAVTAMEQAVAFNKQDAHTHSNLGHAYRDNFEYVKAESAFRRAVTLDPSKGEYSSNLGLVLEKRGRFEDAAKAYEQAQLTGYADPKLGTRMRRSKLHVDLEREFIALTQDDIKTLATAKKLDLAGHCTFTRPIEAARLYEQVFHAEPKLAETGTHRHAAALSAARAALLHSRKASPQASIDADHARNLACRWFTDELRRAGERLAAASDQAVAREVRDLLQTWRHQPDLAHLRDPISIAKLPSQARADWQRFWRDVETMLITIRLDPVSDQLKSAILVPLPASEAINLSVSVISTSHRSALRD